MECLIFPRFRVPEKVSLLHSIRGGPIIGYTMSYPERIEFQISLGDGSVAHYNGVLVSPTRIEGKYFVTGRAQGRQSRASILMDEEGTWTGQAGGSG